MLAFMKPSPAERRLLPEGRSAGPMPWVIGIMMMLTVLATAAGLGIGHASTTLGSDIQGRLTIQLPEANISTKTGQLRAIENELTKLSNVQQITRVSDDELTKLLDPWLGKIERDDELPMPALIDVELESADASGIAAVRAIVRDIAPNGRVDTHASWLAPLAGLMQALQWISIGLVALMTIATGAVVVLAVRAALNTHSETLAILHLLGADDQQVARLFQRRTALDALLGCLGGFSLAIIVMIMVGGRLSSIGSELLGQAVIGWGGWLLIFSLPLLGTLLAALVARYTVTLSLGATL